MGYFSWIPCSNKNKNIIHSKIQFKCEIQTELTNTKLRNDVQLENEKCKPHINLQCSCYYWRNIKRYVNVIMLGLWSVTMIMLLTTCKVFYSSIVTVFKTKTETYDFPESVHCQKGFSAVTDGFKTLYRGKKLYRWIWRIYSSKCFHQQYNTICCFNKCIVYNIIQLVLLANSQHRWFSRTVHKIWCHICWCVDILSPQILRDGSH